MVDGTGGISAQIESSERGLDRHHGRPSCPCSEAGVIDVQGHGAGERVAVVEDCGAYGFLHELEEGDAFASTDYLGLQ